MCTVILLRRPSHAWPLLIAANRDERLDRPWNPPAPHWPERPGGIVGGQDRMAGGTWLAANQGGVVAAVLNRPGSLGPEAGKRSRGELPLLALAERSAKAACAALSTLDAGDWRPFNLILADMRDAFFLRGLGHGRPQVVPLTEGVSMVTAHDPNDTTSPRTRRHLPRFRTAIPPDPDNDDWTAWESLLADDGFEPTVGRAEALRVPPTDGFGTVSSSLLALAADGRRRWRFAAGPAGAAPFRHVPLEEVSR